MTYQVGNKPVEDFPIPPGLSSSNAFSDWWTKKGPVIMYFLISRIRLWGVLELVYRFSYLLLVHTYCPWSFVHVTVVVLLPPVHLSAPFPLWTQVVVVLPLGAANALELARGPIDIAAVAAIIAAAITSVFVSIGNYLRYGFLHKSNWTLFLYINTL